MVLIIAIIQAGDEILLKPDSSSQIIVADSVILTGNLKQIDKFRREVCNDTRPLSERTRNSENVTL